MQTIYVVRN